MFCCVGTYFGAPYAPIPAPPPIDPGPPRCEDACDRACDAMLLPVPGMFRGRWLTIDLPDVLPLPVRVDRGAPYWLRDE